MFLPKETGLLVVLSGPSGVGKGTVCSYLRKEYKNIAYSVSATTREMRPGEIHGVNYFFLSQQEFLQKRDAEEFVEWAEVYGNYYGTPRTAVNENIAAGLDVILEIDTQGAMNVKKLYPNGVFIFLLPPSREELEKRIRSRATDTAAAISHRLACVERELEQIKEYQYVVVNDTITTAAHKIASIIQAEKCRVSRYLNII